MRSTLSTVVSTKHFETKFDSAVWKRIFLIFGINFFIQLLCFGFLLCLTTIKITFFAIIRVFAYVILFNISELLMGIFHYFFAYQLHSGIDGSLSSLLYFVCVDSTRLLLSRFVPAVMNSYILISLNIITPFVNSNSNNLIKLFSVLSSIFVVFGYHLDSTSSGNLNNIITSTRIHVGSYDNVMKAFKKLLLSALLKSIKLTASIVILVFFISLTSKFSSDVLHPLFSQSNSNKNNSSHQNFMFLFISKGVIELCSSPIEMMILALLCFLSSLYLRLFLEIQYFSLNLILFHSMDFSIASSDKNINSGSSTTTQSKFDDMLRYSLCIGLHTSVVNNNSDKQDVKSPVTEYVSIAKRFLNNNNIKNPSIDTTTDTTAYWRTILDLQSEVCSNLATTTTCQQRLGCLKMPMLFGTKGTIPAKQLMCRGFALEDLSRIKNKSSRQLNLLKTHLPAVIFSLCCIVDCTSTQVSLMEESFLGSGDVKRMRGKGSDIETLFSLFHSLLCVFGCGLGSAEEKKNNNNNNTFVFSEMVSQQIVNAIEGIRSLLVSALSEDKSGFSHHFVPAAVASLIGLLLSIEKYSQTINESFQCQFGSHKIRYKIPSPTLLPTQIQSILSANKTALDNLLRAYRDILANCRLNNNNSNKYLHDKLSMMK